MKSVNSECREATKHVNCKQEITQVYKMQEIINQLLVILSDI